MSFWNSEVIKAADEGAKTSFDPIPEGNYQVILTDADIKATKAGGHYLNTKFELSGNSQFDGRILFHKFNVDNANPQAVSIGLAQIKELSIACGNEAYYESLKTATSWNDASEKLNGIFNALGNIPLEVKVVVKQDEKYGASNDIKRFKTISNSVPTVATSAPTSGKKGGAKAPWEK